MKTEGKIFVYYKNGRFTLWKKLYIWHKWLRKTPKGYADTMAKALNRKPDYGPCFYGWQEKAPHDDGYILVGELE